MSSPLSSCTLKGKDHLEFTPASEKRDAIETWRTGKQKGDL